MKYFISKLPIPYPDALKTMEKRVSDILNHQEDEGLWLLEHPPLYSAGIQATPNELLSDKLPVFQTNRGGKYTYHGPGQRIIYVMMDLKRHKIPVREYVFMLEEAGIQTLAEWGITAVRRKNRVGLWVIKPDGQENKIAAVGIRLRQGITCHGMAINVCPELAHFSGIVPCGLKEHGITSIQEMGIQTSDVSILDKTYLKHFEKIFHLPLLKA